jgi:hypothetical protein
LCDGAGSFIPGSFSRSQLRALRVTELHKPRRGGDYPPSDDILKVFFEIVTDAGGTPPPRGHGLTVCVGGDRRGWKRERQRIHWLSKVTSVIIAPIILRVQRLEHY